MSTPRQTQDICAATQATIDLIARSLNDSADGFASHGSNAHDILAQLQRTRDDRTRLAMLGQIRQAQLEHALPGTDIAVDSAMHFARQVWRRRNTV